MRCSTAIFAVCAVLFAVMLAPVAPSPMIKVEGRDLTSRFVPPVHPVFPRTYWESDPNAPTPARNPVSPVKRHGAAQPTASNWVYRSESYKYEHRHQREKYRGEHRE